MLTGLSLKKLIIYHRYTPLSISSALSLQLLLQQKIQKGKLVLLPVKNCPTSPKPRFLKISKQFLFPLY